MKLEKVNTKLAYLDIVKDNGVWTLKACWSLKKWNFDLELA
jgi:hypothetical protein